MRCHAPTRSSRPPREHIIVYDDACPFCIWCARVIARHARHPVHLTGFRDLSHDEWLTALSDEAVRASSHLITPEGHEYHGGESMTRALRLVPGGSIAAVLDWPALSWLRDAVYTLVSEHRGTIGTLSGR